MRKVVIATFEVHGFHRWVKAPPTLGYLGEVHRHKFFFRVEALVGASDREVEFHELQRAARSFLFEQYSQDRKVGELEFGPKSCEMIAEDLFKDMAKICSIEAIEVWEDGECGARVEKE